MERNYFLTLEEQDNLRIVDHLDMQKLPELLQQMLSLATTPEEKDILLMSTLSGAGACVTYIYFRYGPRQEVLREPPMFHSRRLSFRQRYREPSAGHGARRGRTISASHSRR